jgi:hypothetical protein
VEWRDQALVDQFGLRPSDGMNAYEVCEPEMAARMVALMGQRVGYIRNHYNIKLPARFCLLEPMDVIECVDPRLGTFTVLIREIQENDDDSLTITAEEYASSVTRSGVTESAPTTNDPINTGVTASDVNTPIIMQPPPALTGGAREIWAAVSGGDPIDTTDDPLWGGCEVWLSTDGGTSYKMVGTIDAPARMGQLTDALPAYGGTNPDTVNTLKVDFAMSGAVFDDAATPTDAASGVTLSYIKAEGANEEEFLSYETPTLNSADVYWFDELYRGLGGSTAGSHAAGAFFARLDAEAIFKYSFPPEMEGETIWVKFVSFNIWNGGYQDIADVTPYSFTINGDYTYGVGIPDLNDVDLTGLTDGYTLIWDADTGTWTVGPAGGGSGWLTGSGPPASGTGILGNFYIDTDTGEVYGPKVTGPPAWPLIPGTVVPWSATATGTGTSQVITLPYSGLNESGVLVFCNGIRYATSEYSISGTDLTITTNAAGDTIEIVGITR